MRTLILGVVFTVAAASAEEHYSLARQYIAEAKQSRNVFELRVISRKIRTELLETIRLDADEIDARLDLVRYYMVTPALAEGDAAKAREQATEIARRDAALGHFANGYIDYRERNFETARRELRLAAKSSVKPSARILALTWLGWLSQETQQYDEAFWAFDRVLKIDPLHIEAAYEIGRTAAFCRCRVEQGEEALLRYMAATPAGEMPTREQASRVLQQLREK